MSATTIIVTRTVQVPKFYDAAGVPETEAEDADIEVTVSGTWSPAEPDVGIMRDYYADLYAEDEHGNEIELTDRECERAQQALREEAVEAALDALEQAAEAKAERRAEKLREDRA